MKDLHDRLYNARKKYLEAKKNQVQNRENYIKANYTAKEAERRLRVEEQRRQGRVARAITGKLSSGAVSMVIDDQGNRCSGKGPVEQAMIEANRGKHSKCCDTPPMQPAFLNDFGYTGDTPAAEEVPMAHMFLLLTWILT